MATITLRSVKGSPLTNTEVDNNFTNLNNDKIENVVADASPQLGGTLDANGNDIDMGTNVITDTKVGLWDTAYGWGDHSTEGYLTSFTETDPVVGAITGIVKADGAGNISAAAAGTDYAGLSTAQSFTGEQTFAEIKETVFTLATSGTVALDPANGSIQTCASAGPTFTDSLEAGQSLVLHVTGGDSSPVTFPTVTWVTSGGNVAPTATASDVFVFWKISTTLYGAYVGNFV